MLGVLLLILILAILIGGACWTGRDGDTKGKAGDSTGAGGGGGWGGI